MPISDEIVALLRSTRSMLCTIESCTGGLLASQLTDVPGASEAFWGALVTYDHTAKTELAGVPLSLIHESGAVSRTIAIAMAEGGLKTMREALAHDPSRKVKTLFAISTTGIAGPGGGTEETPIGLCWVAIAQNGVPTQVFEVRGNPIWSRMELKAFFAERALHKLVSLIGAKTKNHPTFRPV